jgi:hypothetical protein
MYDAAGAAMVERAREAASRGDWLQAYDLLANADERLQLSVHDLGFLAEAASVIPLRRPLRRLASPCTC